MSMYLTALPRVFPSYFLLVLIRQIQPDTLQLFLQ